VTRLLQDKVILVAGLGGIGNGLVRKFAAEGARLVIGDIDADLVKQVAREVDSGGGRVSPLQSTPTTAQARERPTR
jgi:NAD(P)-dependent dehydrogenase (short-subunit alcohol dehydrogenase family)